MPPNDVARFHKWTEAATAMAACSPLFDADREHAAEAAVHLPQRRGVARMFGKSGIKNLRDLVMADQALGEERRGLGLASNPDIERAHAAHQQPGIESAERIAELAAHGRAAAPITRRRARSPKRRRRRRNGR